MTTSELAAVEALVMQVLPDPMGFAERLLNELAGRLANAPGADGTQVVPGHESAAHESLADRDVLLAAALGACDCWGEDPGCPGCGGRGSPGWEPPDPELYAEYVAPAVRRTAPDGPRAHPDPGPAAAVPGPGPDGAGAGPTDAGPGEGDAR